jgi:phosphatidyl-myo-inositol dimannoside synthase
MRSFASDSRILIAIVTQCFQPDHGGIETLMTSLTDALDASGQTLLVFADRARVDETFERAYEIRRFGQARPLRRWLKRQAIALAAGEAKVEAIFADSWKSVEAIPPDVAPIAVLAHGMELPPDASPRKARRIAAAFARARVVIANSAYTAALARRFIDGAAPRILVIPPPIAIQNEPTEAALAAIDERIAGRGPVLATLARLEPRKGIDAVIRALPALRREWPNLVYLVAGEGGDGPRLRALAASLDVNDAALLLGRVNEAEKAALLARADLFVMPTRRVGDSVEGYGIAYIEAAWRGKASLAGRDGGAADAVIDGETGLLCDGATDDDVLAALMRLLRDDALRDRLGAAAMARARGELVWSAALPRYVSAIKDETVT